jgi:hypothetical protein
MNTCKHCGADISDGERYCSCGAYLRVQPRPSHKDLGQLSRTAFIDALSEGIPLIFSNVLALWTEANEISQLGDRRSVGILQSIAEEEAAKILLLIDCLRCPPSRQAQYQALLNGFADHQTKGIYIQYYNSSPHDLAEVRHIVDLYRRSVYREGEYGEYTAPNTITYWREHRLYVSYFINDDGSHSWQAPYPPDLLEGHIIPSGVITVAHAMSDLGLFARAALAEVAAYWQGIPFESVDRMEADAAINVSWGQLQEYNLKMFQPGGVNFEKGSLTDAETLVDRWLFPLYPFELKPYGSVADLAPPESPDWY